MANLSQEKRARMLAFLETIRQEHKDNDDVLVAVNEIESELKAKKYGIVWEKHEETVDVQMRNNIPVFTECKEREIADVPNDKYNFILEGDNLHSLRLLEKTHKGKIDVIFIDPPYNKGKDFTYDDNRVEKEDAYKHSKWLSFMYERLMIAKQLLADKGSIFISIDDAEQAQLKLLCDEVFGERNFVTSCLWQKIHSVKNDAKHISVNHDYILVYGKDIDKLQIHKLCRTTEMNKRYSNLDNDPRGCWQSGDLVAKENRVNGNYDVIGPTGKIFNVPEGKHWVYSEENMKQLIAENRIWFGKKGTAFPRKKRYLSEVQQGRTPDSMWMSDDVGHNQEAARELKSIFGGKEVFKNPKPTRLIYRILQMASEDNSVILDFFAGSGTTGHTVMKMNAEKNGHRRFILCTNNESNICEEVTYERIRRVVNGYGKNKGIPANVKYFKTDFVPKESDDLENELLKHVVEMVELENGVKIDSQKNLIVLSDEEADELARNWSSYPDVEALYVANKVLFTSEQRAIFGNVNINIIPDYYFKFEMQEVGEIW